ncbi:MAG: LysR family transcriptional regulator [Pseudomonadales bacterium]|nr:LysR family transcriptional regulator [Pseudomonadales bacterium]
MTTSNLETIDLNLLLALKALLHYRHVTEAAESMGITQSGMSRSLRKLRQLLNDELLIRSGKNMRLSVRAENLVAPLDELLENISAFIDPPSFDPKSHNFSIKVAAPDVFSMGILPLLYGALSAETKSIKIEVVNWGKETQSHLATGELDFAFGGVNDTKADIYKKQLSSSEYVCIARKNHPQINKRISLKKFCTLPHVMMTLEGRGTSVVDDALHELGMSRNVTVKVSHFLGAVAVASTSDNLMVISRNLANIVALQFPLEIHELPIAFDMPDFNLYWHLRTHKNPPHQWLRQIIAEVVTTGISDENS